MRTLALVFSILIMPAIVLADWKIAAEKLHESVVLVETSKGNCTAFVIDEVRDLVLTAAHCYDELDKMFVDGKPVTRVVSRETKKDLLVLQVNDIDRPALALAKEDPVMGDQVASNGFGYGLEQPLFKTHHVAHDRLHIDYEGVGGPLIAVDTAYIPGMSGGPLVNANGEVVAIVQRTSAAAGFGVGARTIRDKVGKYFQVR